MKEYLQWSHELAIKHGQRCTVKILKDLNSHAKLLALGKETSPVIELGGIWYKTKPQTGLPKSLKAINREWIEEGPQVVLHILGLVNCIRLPPVLDTGTITGSYTGTWNETEFSSSSLLAEVSRHRIHIQATPDDVLSTRKAGPNHPSALLGALADAWALNKLSSHWESYRKWSEELGLTLHLRVESLVKGSLLGSGSSRLPRMAKLVALADKAGKTRIVYVGNYWVQCLLWPLHKNLMDWLKKQPQDGTYDQARTVETVKRWTAEGKTLSSFDLTAATDRWPVAHQHKVLTELVGSKWADAWLWCMRISPHTESGQLVVYNVGQPMGLLSSWAAFAVTHHLSIRALCRETGASLDSYVVLGDDVVIADPKVAKSYAALLEHLGVTISKGKSIINVPGGVSSAEFAKQLLASGRDLTPVSPVLLTEALAYRGNSAKLVNLFQWMVEHQCDVFEVTNTSILVSPSIALLLQTVKPDVVDEVMALVGLASFMGSLPHWTENKSRAPLHGDNPKPNILCEYVNPFGGHAAHEVLSSALDTLETSFQNELQGVKALHDKLGGGALTVAPGLHLERPAHPWHDIVADLEARLRGYYRVVAEGSYPQGFERHLVDYDYVTKVIGGQTSLRDWRQFKELTTKRSIGLATQTLRALNASSLTVNWEEEG